MERHFLDMLLLKYTCDGDTNGVATEMRWRVVVTTCENLSVQHLLLPRVAVTSGNFRIFGKGASVDEISRYELRCGRVKP